MPVLAALLFGALAWAGFGPPLPRGALLWRGAVTGALALAWVALVLAQTGRFSPAPLAALLAAAGAACALARPARVAAALRARGPEGAAPGRGVAAAALAALLLATGVLTARPGEHFAGGWDPGVYLAAGATVARTGGLVSRDPLLADLTPGERGELFPGLEPGGVLMPGFYLHDASGATVVPQFQPLYPAVLAVATALGGPRAMLFVNPVLAAAGVLLLFSFAAAVRGRRTALLAAALLALSAIQLWNAGIATSEPLAQFLLLAGFRFLHEHLEGGEPLPGVLAAAGFGLAPMGTVTTVLAVPFAAAVAFRASRGAGRPPSPFLPVLALLLAHAAAWSALAAPAYLRQVIGFFPDVAAGRGAAVVAGLGALAAVLALTRLVADDGERARASLPASGVAAAALLAGATAWLALVRPQADPGLAAAGPERLSWFVTPGVLALALAGAAAILGRPRRRAETALLLAGWAMLLFFLFDPRMYPSYPFALRRHTPLALPALALCAAVVPAALLGARRRALRLAGAAVAAAAIAWPLAASRDLVLRPQWRGFLAAAERLAQGLPADAAVLCEGRVFAYALRGLFGREVLVVDRPTPRQAEAIEGFAARRLAAGRPVWHVTHLERPWSARLAYEPAFATRLESERLGQELHRYPSRHERVDLRVVASRVVPLGEAAERFPAEVDVGANALGLGPGFRTAVRPSPGDGAGGGWARWTSGRAVLPIPWPEQEGPVRLRLALASTRGRPGPARVELRLDGAPIGEGFEVPAAFAVREFVLPGGGPRRRALEIRSTTWDPARHGLRGYPDDLGVLLDRVTVGSAGEAAP